MTVTELEHGTVRGYWRGCRCEPCRVAERRYKTPAPRRRGRPKRWCRAIGCDRSAFAHGLCRRHAHGSVTPAEGHVWVACWCDRSLVEIPTDQVGASTGSCGAEGCVPPAELEVDR